METNPAATAAQAYFDAWNRHDVSDILAAFTSDATFWDTTMSAPISIAALEAPFKETLEQFPDLRFVVERILETGSTFAVAEWRMQGTAAGSSSNARRIDVPGTDVFEIKEGKIHAARAYFNAQTMAGQLG